MNFGHGYLDVLAIPNIKGHCGLTVKMEVWGEEGLELAPVNKVDSKEPLEGVVQESFRIFVFFGFDGVVVLQDILGKHTANVGVRQLVSIISRFSDEKESV